MSTLNCNKCGADLSALKDPPSGERIPCPSCGSTARAYGHIMLGGITVSGTATVSATLGKVAAAVGLLVQAIVIPGERTSEGSLIQALAPAWTEIIREIGANPSVAFQISPRRWEEIIAGAYHKAGFDEVTLTPASGDFGRDIIAVKRGLGSVRIIDQVKAYKPGHLVTADDVRALIGVVMTDQASKGFLTTTSDFAPRISTDPLIQSVIPARLELVNGVDLMARLEKLARQD